jgi:hypothetical protein
MWRLGRLEIGLKLEKGKRRNKTTRRANKRSERG